MVLTLMEWHLTVSVAELDGGHFSAPGARVLMVGNGLCWLLESLELCLMLSSAC